MHLWLGVHVLQRDLSLIPSLTLKLASDELLLCLNADRLSIPCFVFQTKLTNIYCFSSKVCVCMGVFLYITKAKLCFTNLASTEPLEYTPLATSPLSEISAWISYHKKPDAFLKTAIAADSQTLHRIPKICSFGTVISNLVAWSLSFDTSLIDWRAWNLNHSHRFYSLLRNCTYLGSWTASCGSKYECFPFWNVLNSPTQDSSWTSSLQLYLSENEKKN